MYEHSERHGFPSEWIGITFSITTFWNGMIAIFAGIISNVTAESLGFGPVAPFVVALAPLVICGILVVSISPFSLSSGLVLISLYHHILTSSYPHILI